jgi:hypothetical protein
MPGRFEPDSVFARTNARLMEMAETLRDYD